MSDTPRTDVIFDAMMNFESAECHAQQPPSIWDHARALERELATQADTSEVIEERDVLRKEVAHLNIELSTLKEKFSALNDEATDYWSFIAGIASYFECKDGVDMREFIMKEFDTLKADAVRGQALARTVMSDQVGKS